MSIEDLEKIARGRSDDPRQESLREDKAEWNEQVSKFITLLIALKQGMNGKNVPPLGIPANTITDPLPDSIPNVLNQLSGVYDKITQEGTNIVQEQTNYSQQRRKPMREVPIAASSNVLITKEGANILTRLWTYISPFQLSDRNRKARLKMLKGTARMEKALRRIEYYLADREQESVSTAFLTMKNLLEYFNNDIIEPLNALIEIGKVKSTTVSVEEPDPETEELSKSLQDPEDIANQEIKELEDREAKKDEIIQRIQKYMSLRDELQTSLYKITDVDISKAGQSYLAIADLAVDQVNQEYDNGNYEGAEQAYSVIIKNYEAAKEVLINYEAQQTITSDLSPEFTKLAQDRLSTWFLRKWLSIWKTEDSNMRKEVLSRVDLTYIELDGLMNILQTKNVPISRIQNKVKNLTKSLSDMLTKLVSLANIHNNNVRIQQYSARSKGEVARVSLIPISEIRDLQRFSVLLQESFSKEEEKEEGKGEDKDKNEQ